MADVGGNLNLQSLQDSSRFEGKQQSIGGFVTIGYGFSASASYSNSKALGDYASVTEQTGIQAGNGGFQVNVKGNTDLQGAVIASTQEAIDHQRNSLTTGTLTASDIENRSDYSASGVNLSGGISVAGNKPADKPGSAGGTGTTGGSNNSTVNNGADWSWQNFGKTGAQGAAAGVSSDSGKASSTTHSGISQGTLTITDAAGQQQKTGQTAQAAADSIQRDVLTGKVLDNVGTGPLPGSREAQRGGVKIPNGKPEVGSADSGGANGGTGAAEGLAFRTDLPSHMIGPDGFTKPGQLSGTHNLTNATSSLDSVGATYTLKPTGTAGVYVFSLV